MTSKELFDKKAVEAGFDLSENEEILKKIQKSIWRLVSDRNCYEEEIGKMALDDVIKADFLCKQFGFFLQPSNNIKPIRYSICKIRV